MSMTVEKAIEHINYTSKLYRRLALLNAGEYNYDTARTYQHEAIVWESIADLIKELAKNSESEGK